MSPIQLAEGFSLVELMIWGFIGANLVLSGGYLCHRAALRIGGADGKAR